MKAICQVCGCQFSLSEGWIATDRFLCGTCGRAEFCDSVARQVRDRITDAWFTLYDLEQSGQLSQEDALALYKARHALAALQKKEEKK